MWEGAPQDDFILVPKMDAVWYNDQMDKYLKGIAAHVLKNQKRKVDVTPLINELEHVIYMYEMNAQEGNM